MRTTLRLDAELLRQAKQRALDRGSSLTALVEEALRSILNRATRPIRKKPVDLPTSGQGGLLPGVDLDDTSALLDRMNGTV